jgi:hypothetical protein
MLLMTLHIHLYMFLAVLGTQRVEVAVTIYTRILEGLNSNLCRDTASPDWRFCGFTQLLQANASIVSQFG